MEILLRKKYIERTTLFLLLLLSVPLAAQEHLMEGFIFKQETNMEDLMYIQRGFVRTESDTTQLSHIYYTENGEEAAFEKATMRNGELISYETAIYELEIFGSVSRDDEDMIISFTEEGVSKTRVIPWKEGLVAGPMLPFFIEENREKLLQGESIEFLLPYFDRQILIPFKLVPNERGEKAGEGEITVKMRLKNFLLGMIIRPIDFIMDRNNGKIRAIHGPTILPEPGSGSNKNFVLADIYYTYRGEIR